MTFQALDQKGWQFLELVDNDDNPIELSYTNGESWLKFIGHSNSLCVRAMRAIVNYAPTGEYKLHFFPKREFQISVRTLPYQVKTSHSP